jgi:DNA polymerase III delta prime subunit
MTITGEGKSQKIPVEKVRGLTEELGKTSTYARIVVIPDASEGSFHRPAANALLKSIEEPPPNCMFFFFADSSDEVLATIVSRCQVVPIKESMEMGYWKAKSGSVDDAAIKRLEAARANFITNARKQYASAAPNAQPFLRGVSNSIELSKQLQDLCKELQETLDEYDAAERVLDLYVACEIEVLRDASKTDPTVTRYMSRLAELAEKCKRQIRDYVKASNAIESFVLALNEIRVAH